MSDEQAVETHKVAAPETDAVVADAAETDAPAAKPTEGTPEGSADSGSVSASVPEFAQVQEPAGPPPTARSLGSVLDVSVTLTAELGRINIPIADLLHLGRGSVIELDRPVSAPIDIRAQGVLLARGEVVVVDDCFAVRLKEVTQPQSAGTEGVLP